MTKKRIKELTDKYKVAGLHEPKRDVFVEANGAIICLRWWGQKPIVSVMRTQEEITRLTAERKFGDVIPISARKAFQQAMLQLCPKLITSAKVISVYDLEFNTLDNVATFYHLLDKIDSNKGKLADTIRK